MEIIGWLHNLGILRIETKINRLFVSLFIGLFVSTVLHASNTYISHFRTSTSIDKKTLTPLEIRNTFQDNVNEIWASAQINNTIENSKVSMVWYYGKQKLKQYDTHLQKDSRFISSNIGRNEGYLFPKGEFRVDFLVQDKKLGSVYFDVVSSSVKENSRKSECTKPTSEDNSILIKDQTQIYPNIKNELSSMKLKRFHDAKERFSLLAPSGWKEKKNLDEDTILYLSKVTDDNSFTEYLMREIQLDKETRSMSLPILLKAISEVIREESGKTGAKALTEPKIYELPDMSISHFVLVRTIKNTKIWEIHTVIADGMYLYDIVTMSDETLLDTGRFLSSLSSYSFWTKESCK